MTVWMPPEWVEAARAGEPVGTGPVPAGPGGGSERSGGPRAPGGPAALGGEGRCGAAGGPGASGAIAGRSLSAGGRPDGSGSEPVAAVRPADRPEDGKAPWPWFVTRAEVLAESSAASRRAGRPGTDTPADTGPPTTVPPARRAHLTPPPGVRERPGEVDRQDGGRRSGGAGDAPGDGGAESGARVVDVPGGTRESGGALAGPDAATPSFRGGPDEDQPTEVLGPFDIGLWTLQGREAGPAPEGVRGRAAARPGHAPDRADRNDDRAGNAEPAPADRRQPTRGDRIRTGVRGIAQTFITLGLVLLLFSAYEVWFTGILNGRTQDRLRTELEQQWERGDDPVIAARKPARPGAKVRSIPLGDGFALIYIPTFGKDYV